jgi:hypothetical protein
MQATPKTGHGLCKLLLPAACCVVFAAGCASLTGVKNTTPPANVNLNKETPAPEELVAFLNRSSAKVTALESRSLDIDVQADKQAIGVSGSLYCQSPKNFRMRAKLMGADQVDFGSNSQEFWFWVRENKPPYLYHCNYTDLERGGIRMPFPFQPEWVLEALGMATRDPGGRYEVSRRDRYLDLTERTTSPQGQPISKVTRLNNFTANGSTPQIVGHYLYDTQNGQNHLVCSAVVSSVHTDAASGAVVPHKIELKWYDQNMTMTLTLGAIAVKRPRTDSPKLFLRPPEYQAFDLARNALDGPPTSIRSAGGTGR